jgi:hypothetical protein
MQKWGVPSARVLWSKLTNEANLKQKIKDLLPNRQFRFITDPDGKVEEVINTEELKKRCPWIEDGYLIENYLGILFVQYHPDNGTFLHGVIEISPHIDQEF